jgi:hypothetical protein
VAVGGGTGFKPGHPSPGALRVEAGGRRKEQGLQIERAPRWERKPPNGPTPPTTRWMVARVGEGRLEPLCVRAGTSKVLPVFSFEEEAEMFLHLGGYADSGWRARESCAGELVSVLLGPCLDVEGVALDPLPEMLANGTLGLVWVGRKRFLGQLSERGTRTGSG